MASLPRNKSVVLFLVACYELAITVSGLFHTHHHDGGNSCCPPPQTRGLGTDPRNNPTSCGCGGHLPHRHDPPPSAPQPQDQPQDQEGHTGDEDRSADETHGGLYQADAGLCPVCSFLAQKTITAELPPEIVWTMLEKACDPKLPLPPALLLVHSWHGRAPPLAA